jgi:heme/copper-type cytochrome/quinol oxidase subunit 3
MDATPYPAPAAVDGAEPADLLARNIRIGARLWAAAQAFFFLAFFFAFLYLRALNTNGLWRGWPHTHPNPSTGYGVGILICILASAAAATGARSMAAATWRLGALAALVLVLVAVVLQAVQFATLSFGPTDGAYASVFVGWSGLFALILLGAAYWLATVVGDVSRVGAAIEVRAAGVDAVSFVLVVLAGVEIAAFILLYIVK